MIVIECVSKIEVALRRVWVKLKGHLVRVYWFFKKPSHVISIAQIEECWSIEIVKADCLFVVFNCIIILLENAQGISEVVVSLTFFGVLLYSFLVMMNSILSILQQVMGITKVVVYISQVSILFKSPVKVLYWLFVLIKVVACISKPN